MIEMKDLDNTYRTRDLAEAAALLVEGMELLKMNREGAICWFIFRDKEKCVELSDKYFFGNLLVPAREFHDTVGKLKNRIFSTM
jgi:hypothetical protein